MSRIRFWAMSAFVVAACGCTTAIEAPDINDELRSKYQDKQVMLRNFYCGPELRFDPQGNVVAGAGGPWTVCRDIRIENVKFTEGKIRIEGRRVFLFYDSDKKRFRDTWQFKPAMKDGKPVAVEVSVEVAFNLY